MLKQHRLRLSIVAAMFLSLWVVPGPVHASASCELQITPTELNINSVTNVQFSIANNGDEPLSWVQVTRPDTNFTVIGIVVDDWTDDTNSDGSTLSDGVITPGQTLNFQLGIQTGPNTDAAGWNLLVSSSQDSSGAINCSGDTAMYIVDNSGGGGGPPPSGIGSVGVSALTPTTAKVNWHSDTLTGSVVYYGKTTSYGRASSYNQAYVNEHSVQLTGLSPNTVYHYKVSGNDSASTTYTSDDSTFATPPLPPPPAPITPSGALPPTTTKVTVPKVPGDSKPPVISIDTKLDRPFKSAPEIRGSAQDNGALAAIEYSIDNGANWLPVDKIGSLGKSQSTYSFTPMTPEDGNYAILTRAIDSNGNIGQTGPFTLVIDRLPPQIGPLVVSYGPEILGPDESGVIALVAGSDYRLATSAIGGPTSIQIEATLVGQKNKGAKTFTLAQSPDSGLWNGLLSFKAGGTYELVAHSIDGAHNVTTRQIMVVAISPAGQTLDKTTKKPLSGATLTLYYREPSLNSWQVWDGTPYSQTNPQKTQSDGSYTLMAPAGKYYLQIKAPLHGTITSDIFTLAQPTAITTVVAMSRLPHLNVGLFTLVMPDINWQSQPLLTSPFKAQLKSIPSLVGKALPDFNLPTTSEGQLRGLSLTGKPSLISILSTWTPDSQNQLAALAAVQRNKDINVVPVFSQEHKQLVQLYLKTAGYDLNGVVDTDGVLVPALNVGAVPEHFFVDRTGTIKKTKHGVYSQEQLLSELGSL